MNFFTQKKNYSFLALNLNCQNQERKKHISPALGKSPRNEKCHFPSTGKSPSAGSPQTVKVSFSGKVVDPGKKSTK